NCMETLGTNQEIERPLSEYKKSEVVDLIYSEERDSPIDLKSELSRLSREKDLESAALEKLLESSDRHTSNPRIQKQISNFESKIEEIQADRQMYDMFQELNLYHIEGVLKLEDRPIEDLLESYRSYKTFFSSIDSTVDTPVIKDIETIVSVYTQKIIELLEKTGVEQKYGLGRAVGRPVDVDFLEHLNMPDTKNPEFTTYRKRLKAKQQGNSRLLTDGQKTNLQDDFKGSESERKVNEELIKVPGVLATIDIPKFSIGDTRHKADTIVITLNSELRDSITGQEVQLAMYHLIEEYTSSLLGHIIKYADHSLISPKDSILGDIIRVNKDIHLDDIAPELRGQNINLSDILQMHKIQIKTQSTEMARALQDYTNSKNAIDPDKVGFLAREYHQPGDPQAEEFNKIHFQIAAQKVLGLPIQ
ncbi:MAG: hypothetical protein WD512_19770, partial [Candidatus Paceibacterota bacterium]